MLGDYLLGLVKVMVAILATVLAFTLVSSILLALGVLAYSLYHPGLSLVVMLTNVTPAIVAILVVLVIVGVIGVAGVVT